MAARLFAGDPSGLAARDDLVPGRSLIVGSVRHPLPALPEGLARFGCRNNALALLAFEQIREDLACASERFGAGRIGIVVGTSTSGVDETGRVVAYAREHGGALPAAFDYVQLEHGGLAEFLRHVSGVTGPSYVISTACSSSAKALQSARGLLRLGACDAVITGGVDTLAGLTTSGFSALEAVSASVCRPFSVNRDGLNLGEAAALFLMTREPGGVQLVGAGDAAEAHHISAPDPQGRGAEAAMRAALADAGCAPDRVGYLNLHGTGTPLNDRMEAAAVHRVFGRGVRASSTKPLVGHTLGAAGATEAAFCWLALSQGEGAVPLPPHLYDGEYDPDLPRIDLCERGEVLESEQALLMSCSYAFGGSCSALILGRDPG